MFTAASMPMWVAILALLGTVLSPIIQGRINKNSPVNKADAAERFTRIAAGVADDYEELRAELRELKPLLQELIRLLDQVQCGEGPLTNQIRAIIAELRKKMY
ncbi:hypothetical protein SEA_STEAMEDHAMS_26 [Gordonia phage SteamedHams]|nr:hypothetical protein SEA_STEAMEDHAMS_26 [Gordonia phage SteamedHams]QWY82450.1 hypothetical protein SEA_TOLLS_26 [Gordonia phage Tolls]